MLGLSPDRERTPLQAETTGITQADDVTVEKTLSIIPGALRYGQPVSASWSDRSCSSYPLCLRTWPYQNRRRKLWE